MTGPRNSHIVVVGSGGGGATVAREVARAPGVRVTVVEAGSRFRPFRGDLGRLALLRRSGLFFDERMIAALFPAMRVTRVSDGLRLVRGVATGGSTTLTTGSAVRCDAALRSLGLDLTSEYARLERELGVTTDHRGRWRESTVALWDAATAAGLEPEAMPKMIDPRRCRRCGRCVLGCEHGARWDARRLLEEAVADGAQLLTDTVVDRLVLEGDRAVEVRLRRNGRTRSLPADGVVVAAGGLGTPAILARSGISTEDRLFVDPVLCVAAPWPGADQDREVPMPFSASGDGYMIAPYFDHLSFFFDRRWRRRASSIVSLMVKLADEECGSVDATETRKGFTERDRRRLREAVAVCRDMLVAAGVRRDEVFLGMPNAGHPGGTLPLDERSVGRLCDARLPDNVYVADASLLPASLGAPPSLTIMALSSRVARACLERLAG